MIGCSLGNTKVIKIDVGTSEWDVSVTDLSMLCFEGM